MEIKGIINPMSYLVTNTEIRIFLEIDHVTLKFSTTMYFMAE